MSKLAEFFEVEYNEDGVFLLSVKQDFVIMDGVVRRELIKAGVFYGDEKGFRITKISEDTDKRKFTTTIWRDGEKPKLYRWSIDGMKSNGEFSKCDVCENLHDDEILMIQKIWNLALELGMKL